MPFAKDTNKYPYKSNPVGNDYLLGSDSENNGVTKSFKVSAIQPSITNEAWTTTWLFDKDYDSLSPQEHTQSGALEITLSTSGAVNGKYNLKQIVADGNDIVFSSSGTIKIFQNNATGVTSDIANYTFTPTSGNTYIIAARCKIVSSVTYFNIWIADADVSAGDVTAPTIGTFAIADANPDRITFVSSEIITGTTFGGFTISTGQTITGITINSGQLTGHYFTVDTAFTEADGTPTIAYSGTGCNIQDTNSNALASFTATNITNNVIDPPAFVSAEIGNVADDILVVVYNKAVNATTAGHNLDTDGSALSISSISSGSGTTTINFQLSRSVLSTETLNYDYSQASGNTLAVTGGKELSEITNEAVTNNVAGDTTPPTFSAGPASANVQSTSFDITATLNENGTVYVVVVADGAAAPTSSEVKAGTGSGGSGQLATGSASDTGSGVTINLTGLSASTAYDVYVVAEDTVPNLQASPTLVNVSTTSGSTYSTEIAADVASGDLHFSALETSLFTLTGSDIDTVDSIGTATAQLTGGLRATTNKPSLDTGNGWVHFDKSNTEELGEDGTFAAAQAVNDKPFSFAFVGRVNTLDSNAYDLFGFLAIGDTARLQNRINTSNQSYIIKTRCGTGTSLTSAAQSIDTNFHIWTGFCTGTAITIYKDETKVVDATNLDLGDMTCINTFLIGGIANSDMDIKEFAWMHSNVGDTRVQAWNSDLNSIYSVY